MLASSSRVCWPGCKDLLESALTGAAFFDRKNSACPILVDDGDIEPPALLEQRLVRLHVGRRKADQKVASRYPHGHPCDRHPPRVLAVFHHDAWHAFDA